MKARPRHAVSGGAILVTAMILCPGLAGCGSSEGSTLTVFAAASLKGSFSRLAEEFEARNPGSKVLLNFAGSADLASQIIQGAPADVFASADAGNMAKVRAAGLLDGSTAFATNTLTIAVPAGNPASIRSFADLARPGVRVVSCASQVPCGAATDAIEAATGITLRSVSEESAVTDVLNKVTAGEADAGLVYVTDVRAARGKATGIPFAESERALNTYPIATLSSSRKRELAESFVSLVTGDDGRKILSDAGFGLPTPGPRPGPTP